MKSKIIIFLCIFLLILTIGSVNAENKTFSDLQDEINGQSDNVVLNDDYKSTGCEISINKSISIEGKNHTLDGEGKSHIFKINAERAVLKNINFKNAISNTSGASILFKGSDLTIINCTFTNSHAGSAGGALCFSGATLNISHTLFKDNTASDGAGAVFIDSGNADIVNTTFKNNMAQNIPDDLYTNGDLRLINSTYNYYSFAVYGNLSLNSTSKSFHDLQCLIDKTDNMLILHDDYTYINGDNTGVLINKSITVDGANHILDGNKLSRIFDITHDGVVLKNIVFQNACAADGGAVSLKGKNARIINCTFLNNSCKSPAKLFVKFTLNGDSVVKSSYNTSASMTGAAISLKGEGASFVFCKFINNTSPDYGAVYITGDKCLFKNCVFKNNSGQFSSALYLNGNNGAVEGSNFDSNMGRYCIYFIGDSLLINASYFNRNVDPVTGSENNFKGDNFDVVNTKAEPVVKNSFADLQYFIDISYDTLALDKDYIQDSTSQITISKSITVDGGGHTLDANSTSGIFKITDCNVILKNINFINALNNGAIQFMGGNLTLVNCNFTYCCSNTTGGALTFAGDNLKVLNSTFINNTVCEGTVVCDLTQVSKYPYFSFGGAIYAEGEVLIDNSRFIDNTALESVSLNSCGGAIFSCTGNVTVINTDFKNNTAQNIRNDVYVRENLRIINSTYDYYYVTVIGNLTLDKRLNDYSLIDSSFGEISKLINDAEDALILTKDYTYIDGQDTGILINKSITIDGANHILDGAALSSIFNIVHEGVVLKNIVFKNGRSYKNAGAVNCHASNAAIVNCSFINHSNKPYAVTPKVGSEYVFSGEIPTVFAYNPAQGSSIIHNEIVFFSGDSITISDSKFISNNLTGSVLSLTANKALISWCDFNDNTGGTLIYLFGDNIVIDSCNFQNNKGYKAIYHGGNSLIVNSTYFNNNTDFGNEFVNVSGVNFTIINPKTTPNTRNSFKYLQHLIDGADDKLILDCDYIQCDTNELVISKKLTLDGSGHTLDANSSSRILKVLASDVVVKNITFKNGMALGLYHNLTGIGGAAVYWQGLNGVLANCTFLNNQAKGLLYDQYAQSEIVTEENGMTIITHVQRPLGATTNRGGAVVWLADNGKVTDCVFKNNSVDYPNFGGAIYWSGDNGLVEKSQFYNNSAWLGCAIYYSGNSLKVKASKFSDNTFAGMKNRDLTGDNITLIQPSLQDLAQLIKDSPDCVVLDCDYFCQSGDGCILVNKTITIDGKGHTIDGVNTLRIFKITADNVVLKNINFINGNSTLGGCILWIGDNATVINCSFKNSTSSTAGGAVALKGSNARIINSTFVNNTVESGPYSAFSLFEKDPSDIMYPAVMISYGGAAYIQGDNASIISCSFSHNTAVGYSEDDGNSKGGALYFAGLNATVKDSGFITNHASFDEHISGDADIINSTFESSVAAESDLSQIISENLVIYYKSTRKFTVKVYNKAGEPASGEMVTFIINGKIRHVISDNSGEAAFKIKSKPGTYSVTTIWGDLSVVNNLIVKKRLITHNLVKKVKKTAVFKVKVLNSKGKRYAKQTVKIKFKGKTYKIKTNSKGIASFKLSKNLKKGKYTIKTTYLGFSVFNKITVKR